MLDCLAHLLIGHYGAGLFGVKTHKFAIGGTVFVERLLDVGFMVFGIDGAGPARVPGASGLAGAKRGFATSAQIGVVGALDHGADGGFVGFAVATFHTSYHPPIGLLFLCLDLW